MRLFPPSGAGKAGTEKSGDITEDTLWDLTGSPYVVISDVTVDSGATLTIDGDVTVLFRSGNVSINVDGTLIASDVTFTAEVSAPERGAWDGIELHEGSSSSTLENCIIKYAGRDGNYDGNIQIDNSSPLISGCLISESNAPGTQIRQRLSHHHRAVPIQDNSKEGIDCEGASSPTIEDCTFVGQCRGGLAGIRLLAGL